MKHNRIPILFAVSLIFFLLVNIRAASAIAIIFSPPQPEPTTEEPKIRIHPILLRIINHIRWYNGLPSLEGIQW